MEEFWKMVNWVHDKELGYKEDKMDRLGRWNLVVGSFYFCPVVAYRIEKKRIKFSL